MRWILGVLLVLFLLLQYQLWFGDRGVVSNHRLQQKTEKEQAKADKVQHKNDLLTDKIKRLKTSPELVESYARQDLAMIKDGEVFYRFSKTK
jgi:cell division protein FtsB